MHPTTSLSGSSTSVDSDPYPRTSHPPRPSRAQDLADKVSPGPQEEGRAQDEHERPRPADKGDVKPRPAWVFLHCDVRAVVRRRERLAAGVRSAM